MSVTLQPGVRRSHRETAVPIDIHLIGEYNQTVSDSGDSSTPTHVPGSDRLETVSSSCVNLRALILFCGRDLKNSFLIFLNVSFFGTGVFLHTDDFSVSCYVVFRADCVPNFKRCLFALLYYTLSLPPFHSSLSLSPSVGLTPHSGLGRRDRTLSSDWRSC